MINVLYISPDFNYACGVSKNVFRLLRHFNNQKDYNIYFITNEGDALSKLKRNNINFYVFKFTKGWENIFYFPFNFIQLKRFCTKNKIDIIHTHHRYPELLANLLKKRRNIKTIATAHSFVNGYEEISFKSDKIIAVSNTIKNSIIENFNTPTEKVTVMYNCVNQESNENNQAANQLLGKIDISEGDFVILYAGRINRVKGIDVLVNAFKKVKKAYTHIKLILIGDILNVTFSSLGAENNDGVFHLPPRENINEFYKFSNVIVLPSRVEAIGYTMLEAGYYKKPFIGSRTGGIAEFLEDGVNGFLFEPGNADDLAEKIKFVIDNPENAKSAAEELHKKVKKYCNCEDYFAKLTSIYEDLVNSP